MSDFDQGYAKALTKAEHDRLVELRGRPVTQRIMTKRNRSAPTHDGNGVTGMSDGLGHSRAEQQR